MSLKLRRGTNTQRTGITPAEGELIYTTDTKKLYVGDGSTIGGIAVDTSGSGITDIVQDTTPQLGGDLDVNGYYFVSSADIRLAPNNRVVVGSPTKGVDGNLLIVRESYSVALDAGISYFQHHETVDAVNLNLIRTRGTNSTPTSVLTNDDLGEINFVGHTGTTYNSAAQITAQVDGSPTSSQIPARLIFQVNNGVSRTTKAELSSSGAWKTDNLQSLTTNTDLTITANGTGQIILDGMRWPASDGTNGQVLTTNGSGTLSWTSISAGSTQSSTHNVATLSGTTNWGDGTAISVNDNNNTQYISFTNTLGGLGRATLPNITTIGKIVILSTTSTDGTNVDKYKFPGNTQSNAIVGNNASGLIVLLSLGSGGWKLISQITD
jgi:hypothetical protein